jgi:2'-5' RNA ligase
VAQVLAVFFDADADAEVRALWRKLESAGIPGPARRDRPHVTLAAASVIPPKTRAALAKDLALLSLPALWLYTLGTFPTAENALFLGAVTDTELIAVHSAVHDVLAGRVTHPQASCLPGAWVPHCTLAVDLGAEQLAAGFAALHPIEPIRAKIATVGIVDTRTGEVSELG